MLMIVECRMNAENVIGGDDFLYLMKNQVISVSETQHQIISLMIRELDDAFIQSDNYLHLYNYYFFHDALLLSKRCERYSIYFAAGKIGGNFSIADRKAVRQLCRLHAEKRKRLPAALPAEHVKTAAVFIQ